tara:strand:+ start:1161 stop:1643 length:483 start_codon:yes stop_codon:yes gene_type:complete
MNLERPISQAGVILLFSFVVSFASNFSSDAPLPLIAKDLEEATEEDLNSDEPVLLVVSLDQAKSFYDNKVLFLDARDEAYFNKGHIKGALKNIFLMELIFNIEEIQKKSDPLVVYCGDPGCGDSEDLAYNLQDYGFTKLYVFKGGWLEWSAANYPSEKID